MNKTTVEEVLQRTGKYVATPVGTSMYPMLRSRTDTALIVPVTRALKRGDVILYRRPSGQLVLHRICRTTPNGYVLGGDNLPHREHGVQPSWVIGVMEGLYRGERYIPVTSFGYRMYRQMIFLTHYLRVPYMRLRDRLRRKKG